MDYSVVTLCMFCWVIDALEWSSVGVAVESTLRLDQFPGGSDDDVFIFQLCFQDVRRICWSEINESDVGITQAEKQQEEAGGRGRTSNGERG